MIKVNRTPAIIAIFDDDDNLKHAIKEGNDKGYKVLDCFTPFPVHGIERLLGIKRSNLAVAAFVFGCIGFSLAMTLMTYTMRIDWPEDIGGKPTWPLTSFIPILFEMSVLIASLGMINTYFWVNGMFPGIEPIIYDKRSTDDHFVLIYREDNRGEEIKASMAKYSPIEVRNDEFISHNFPGPLPILLKK
jgi:hypothetical protein